MPCKTLEDVRQMVAAIRATVPDAAVIVYHHSPITPRIRLFHDTSRPRYHLSLGITDRRALMREYMKLRDAGRAIVIINADMNAPKQLG